MAYYTTIAEVRNCLGVSDTTIMPDATITQAIEWAEDEVDRWTNTTYYPAIINGTVTSAGNTTLVDSSKTWTTDQYNNYAVYIYAGTGSGQIREILDTATTTLTVSAWTTNPDATSKYYITYLNKKTDNYDGTGTRTLLLKNSPLIQVDSLTVDGTSVTPSNLYIYPSGQIILKTTAEKTYFIPTTSSDYYQIINITYHYGVLSELRKGSLELPTSINRFTACIASLKALTYQIGGTYDDLSSFQMPDFSGTIGQAYINIDAVVRRIIEEVEMYKKKYIGQYATVM